MFSGILFIIIAWVYIDIESLGLGFSIFLTIWGSLCIMLDTLIITLAFCRANKLSS